MTIALAAVLAAAGLGCTGSPAADGGGDAAGEPDAGGTGPDADADGGADAADLRGPDADAADVAADVDLDARDTGPPADRGFHTFDELPDCDRDEPDLACIRQLFLPLRDAPLPFDPDVVARALGANETQVASAWALSAHHVLEADLMIGVYGCFFAEYRYAEGGVPFSGPGCGELLAAGGHPHAPECQEAGTAMANCVDEVPYEEAFDLVVHAVEPGAREGVVELAPALPAVGDRVFVVGYPGFAWLGEEDRQSLAADYPFVSAGRVLRADGRGLVVDAPASAGNSGGPLLDASGRIVGVLSTLVGHQRARGTAVPQELADHHAVAVAIDEGTRVVVAKARAAE